MSQLGITGRDGHREKADDVCPSEEEGRRSCAKKDVRCTDVSNEMEGRDIGTRCQKPV